jgi:L-ascorbate metabolism protein UlaG (beta-lactamase superfamily)
MALEITWLGRNCFRLKGREGVVVTDPCPPESGYKIGKVEANVVTISRVDDPGYNYREALKGGEARFLDAPGEYEVGGILVTGIATKRPDGARNVAFIIELDGIKVAHLGVPQGAANAIAVDDLKGVDILLLPVGGFNSVTPAVASDVMQTIDARVAIPMNYKIGPETMDLEPLDRFLKETGTKPEPQARLQVSKSGLPAELTVMVLQPRL